MERQQEGVGCQPCSLCPQLLWGWMGAVTLCLRGSAAVAAGPGRRALRHLHPPPALSVRLLALLPACSKAIALIPSTRTPAYFLASQTLSCSLSRLSTAGCGALGGASPSGLACSRAVTPATVTEPSPRQELERGAGLSAPQARLWHPKRGWVLEHFVCITRGGGCPQTPSCVVG